MVYEWDRRKAAANFRKHRVSFPEATTVFLDPLATTYDDPDHSLEEQRSITIGRSIHGVLLFVAHYEPSEGQLRLISARRATRRETHAYTEET